MKSDVFIKLVFFSLAASVVGCMSMVPGEGGDIDFSQTPLRHVWAVLPVQERTQVDVNDEDSIRRGKAVYETNCQICHGPKGKGDGPLASKYRPANLQAIARKSPNHYMFMQIQDGKNNMPSWKDFITVKEAWDVTNYIQTLNDNPKK